MNTEEEQNEKTISAECANRENTSGVCWWCHAPLDGRSGDITVKMLRRKGGGFLIDAHVCGDGRTHRHGTQGALIDYDESQLRGLLGDDGKDRAEIILLGVGPPLSE